MSNINIPEVFGISKSISKIQEVETLLCSLSFLEKEMTPTDLVDALEAIKYFLQTSISNVSEEHSLKCHPLTREPATSYDYVKDLKGLVIEYLNGIKETNNVKTKAFYELWVVPVCEFFRYSKSRDHFVTQVIERIDTFLNTIDFYNDNDLPLAPLAAKEKTLLMIEENMSRGVWASYITESRLRLETIQDVIKYRNNR